MPLLQKIALSVAIMAGAGAALGFASTHLAYLLSLQTVQAADSSEKKLTGMIVDGDDRIKQECSDRHREVINLLHTILEKL